MRGLHLSPAYTLPLLLLGMGAANAADPMPDKLVVATWNLAWFFDDYKGDNLRPLPQQQSAANEEAWEKKKTAVAGVIAKIDPTIIALQEVENLRVLRQLRYDLRDEHKLDYQIAYCEGFDSNTEQDVAILAKSGLTAYGRRQRTAKMLADDTNYYSVTKHLFAEFEWESGQDRETLTMYVVHFRAQRANQPIRVRQARTLRHWIAPSINRGENVIVLGDFNTFVAVGETTNSDEIGIIRGLQTPGPDDDLADLHALLPVKKRDTHRFGGQLDRILASGPAMQNAPGRRDLTFVSIDQRKDLVPRELSDHFPLVATFDVR